VERYEGRVTFLGIPALDGDDAMLAFVDRHGLERMPQAVDDDGELWARFGVRVQPAWVFVAPDGSTQTVLGALYDQALFDRIDGFLAETGGSG
jgi:hypothetical protein